jgi:hypothetical protein
LEDCRPPDGHDDLIVKGEAFIKRTHTSKI